MVTVLAPDGTIVDMNRTSRLAEIAGKDVEDLKGISLADTPLWSSSADAQSLLRRAIPRAARGEVLRFPEVHLNYPQRGTVIDFTIVPVFGGDGQVSHLITSAASLTDRKRAEERLQEQQAALAHLERTPHDGADGVGFGA